MSDDDCTRCGHPFDDHVLSMPEEIYEELAERVAEGLAVEGFVTCPVPGCGCVQTWNLVTDVTPPGG